jgi:hypothetical protein
MGKVKVKIRAPFGEIVVEGENPQEILKIFETFPEDFMEKTVDMVSLRLVPTAAVQLKGVVEFTTEGPVIMTREKLTHYEAIGLVLYASEGKNTAAQITKLLESSGIKSMVPARLNEMTKRGRVFKPDPNRPEFKLTVQGERWVEEEVLARLRGKMS